MFLSYLRRRLAPYFLFFLICETMMRVIFIVREWPNVHSAFGHLIVALLIGVLFDAAVFAYFAIPLMLYALCMPRSSQGHTTDRLSSAVLFFAFSYTMLFTSIGEWFFWDEFQARYNFIAVDYLIYTKEVIGNIRESYPVNPLLAAIGVSSVLFAMAFYRLVEWPAANLPTRAKAFGAAIILAILSFVIFHGSLAERSQNRYVNEIARNGIFELFSAFRHNELSYSKFYISKPLPEVASALQKDIGFAAPKNPDDPLLHHVTATKQTPKYNLVLITVESLSGDYLTVFGNKKHLTPHLDKLADQSLFFTNLYATGTRTVYGLSAITLSMPPIPGNSIVRRPENGHLASLGGVLKNHGYVTKFIYGGYGYFDNMNAFFASNGYQIVDRATLSKNEIHFANVWGVADDDIYRRVIKENDKEYKARKPFFDMIMTTSNHRPFTYPDGKIDIPSHTGREGGVKYTDYTINEFLNAAKKRPWFGNTIFVIIADHTAGSAGKSELEPTKYHIPLFIYAPGIVQPRKIDKMASQIDLAPTILDLMGISYDSRFYGQNLLTRTPGRAFISNYQQLGYMTKDGLVIIKPVKQAEFFTRAHDEFKRAKDVPAAMLEKAIAYFEGASQWKTWSRQPAH